MGEANRRVRELAEPRRMPVKGNKFFEIVLIKDHERLGSAGDTMKVRKGYYRNILWPQGFAQRASADVVQELENKAAAMDKKSQAAMKGQIEAKKKIEKGGKPYIFGKKVRPGTENIYGSLSQINVAEAVIQESGYPVRIGSINVGKISALGEYSVTIELSEDVTAYIKVEVVNEGDAGGSQEGSEE